MGLKTGAFATAAGADFYVQRTSAAKSRNAAVALAVAGFGTMTAIGLVAGVQPAFALDPIFPDAPHMLRTAQATETPDDGALPSAETLKKKPAAPVTPAFKPLAKTPVAPTTAGAAKPTTSAAVKPTPVGAAKPLGPLAKSAAAKVSPAAKKVISVAALTGQDVLPDHHHVSIDVPQTPCPGNPDAIGLSRIIKVDTTGGFYVGQTYHTKMPLLNPREVILTFDDGPHPTRTDRVLKALKDNCTKATFFMIGQMAKAYPWEARKVADAGMTIGYHTMTHSYKLAHGPLDQSQLEISNGWKAVDEAVYGKAGDKPMTHFFRYPGLFNNRQINEWFNTLNMGVFAVDAVGNDWLKGHFTAAEYPAVMNEALNELERNNGGILLLHDIKDSSSTAIGPLLTELKKRGFKIVHVEPLIPPPPVATGPTGPGEVDDAPKPIGERTVDGFDPAHQIAQERLGKVGKPSDNPAPLPAYKPPVPAAETSTDPAATQSVHAVSPAPIATAPVQTQDDGWFSSTAKTFKGIGSAVGLW